MKKNVKKMLASISLCLVLGLLFSSVASAYSVTANGFYYTKSGNVVSSAKVNTWVNTSGSVTYDTWFGPLPIPSTCYFYYELPYSAIATIDTVVTGSWSDNWWSVVSGADSINAYSKVYQQTHSFNTALTVTKSLGVMFKTKSYATGSSGSPYYGLVGSGKGHDVDSNSIAGFYVTY
jgi:hypothetical protein